MKRRVDALAIDRTKTRILIVSQGVVYDDAWRGLPVSVVYDS
jgi:hypothetical protein